MVRDFKPDLVGLSLRNLDNGSYLDPQWALPVTKEVTERVRSASDAVIVCGGPAFSILPEACFGYVEPDLGIAGDGGETFALLADRLDASEGVPRPARPGVSGGRQNRIQRPAVDVAISPNRRGWKTWTWSGTGKAGFGIGVLTKLGDFWYPASGSAQAVEDMAWRVIRPVQDVVEEVQSMERRLGLRKVFFIDNGFNIPLDHAKSLCRALIQADLKLHWNTVLAAPHLRRGVGGPDETGGLRPGAHGRTGRRQQGRGGAGAAPGRGGAGVPAVRGGRPALHDIPGIRRAGGDEGVGGGKAGVPAASAAIAGQPANRASASCRERRRQHWPNQKGPSPTSRS